MIDLDPQYVAAAITLLEPLVIRNIAFDTPTFDLLKGLQRKLEGRIKRGTSNAEVLKYLLHSHPEAAQALQ